MQEAFRSAAIPSLAERLQQRHERQRAATDRKLCGVQDAQQALAARRQQLEQATSSCAAERDALERTLQELAVRSVELDSWLDEYGKQVQWCCHLYTCNGVLTITTDHLLATFVCPYLVVTEQPVCFIVG